MIDSKAPSLPSTAHTLVDRLDYSSSSRPSSEHLSKLWYYLMQTAKRWRRTTRARYCTSADEPWRSLQV